MKRIAVLLAAVVLGTVALATPASAAKCVLVPDLDGHVWELCLR